MIYSVSIVLVLVLAGSVSADLIGHWRFDEGSGIVAIDSSGNGNDGTLQGDSQWVKGRLGGAWQGNGTSGYIRVPHSESLMIDDAVTVALWLRGGAPPDQVICKSDGSGAGWQSNYAIRLDDQAPARRINWRGRDVANQSLTSFSPVPDNEWVHIACTFDVGTATNKIYINGVLDSESRATLPLNPGSGDLYIGADQYPANGVRWWFQGMLDDIRIYNQALPEGQIQTIMLGSEASCPFASRPSPANGATHEDTWITLRWSPGDSAVSHDVYLGDNFDDVHNSTGGTFQGNQPSNYLLAGLPGYPYPHGLVPGTTYYWRIDEVEANGVTKHRGSVWNFFVPPCKAYNPVSADGEELIDTYVTLTWASGLGAAMHTVYFGDDPEAVEDAVDGMPQTLSRYYPGELEFDKTYYWRVDEFDGAETHKGDVWSFTTMPEDEFWASAYYVDGENRIANDSNPGTEARPFKTIGRGLQSLQPGDTLLIKAGTYRETVILTRSGTQAKPIRIQAFPGDEGKVIINAAEPVTNWRKCTGPGDCAGNPYWDHIYVADVAALVQSHPDSAFAVRQVFQNGKLLNRSRYPNTGWSYPMNIQDPDKMFSDSFLSKPDGYFVGSVCHIKTAVWHLDQITITGFSRGVVTLAISPRFEISTQFGYYITSIVGEINEEGEWAYDPVEKKIFMWPKGDVAEGVEFTYRRYCVRTYHGTSWNIVRGLTMRNAYTYGIWLYRANDMTIENNTIDHTFTFGIYLQSTGGICNNNQILNNTVRHSCFRGISVGGDASYCRVEGNYVYATGVEHYGDDLMHGPSHGVYISGPFAKVYNNRIDRTGYTALYLDGHTLGREVSCNYITNVALALSDTGGIYMGSFYEGPQKDHIHHNIIEDVIGCLSMDRKYDKGLPVTIERYSGAAPGIYIDEEGNNRIIEQNTVIRSHMAGVFLHWAPSNLIQKNTLYGNGEAQVYLSGKHGARTALVDDVVLENIMFATNAQQKTLYIGMNYDDVRFGQSDNNYFYNPYARSHVYVSRYVTAEDGTIRVVKEDMTLNEWRAMSGYDRNSKEFSYLDQFENITIDARKDSRIVYNASLDVISIDLESDKYCDVHGNKIYGSVSLQPFESKILIFADIRPE